ncbi:NAD-dependent dehydratase [Brumimicrobium salinarum]|uniref:NAD-dependent dehydratase n=1 Tax=Brumimicrobium salinarum TaxID=2058658 RepID=A0A2I0QZ39_9FLAO|nr:SDR family oxidoreductase [Brumimicrobium salinarum]PKR79601.1 NAD-dependent dehydratase [Brumimicrobium salinarum]
MSNKKQSVLVAGANGTTGRIVIELLKNSEEYEPVALVRSPDQQKSFEQYNVSTILGDLESDLSDTIKNTDKAIFAAGSGGKKVKEVDQEGAKHFIDVVKNAGANKFVMLSSMGADTPSVMPELEEYLKAKQNADDYLRESGIKHTIVRPGGLTDENGTGKIKLQEKMESPGQIPRADVAQTLVSALSDDVRNNETFEIISGEDEIEKVVKR